MSLKENKHGKFFVTVMLMALTIVFIGSMGVADAASKNMNLSAAHVMSEKDPYHLGIARFCDLVKERTGGRIDYTMYANGKLGAERDITEGVSMGTIDLAVVTNAFCVNLAPELGVLDFPYLFESREDAYRFLDSDIAAGLFKTLERSNIVGLAFMENGFRNLNTRAKMITTPEQIKGMKIRTMETPVHLAAFKAAGANATPVSAAELYTSLQQGTVDGHENPIKSIYDYNFYEVCPFIAKTEHFYSTVNLIINKGVWDSLSLEDQAIMRQAAKEATVYQRESCIAREAETAKLMLDAGVKIEEGIDKAQWKAAMSPVYQDSKLTKLHSENLKKIRAYLGYAD